MTRKIALALRRMVLPAVVFAAVFAIHFLWVGLFPDHDPAQAGWALVPTAGAASWLHRYIAIGAFWMGYTYALPLAFAAATLRTWRERRVCGTRRLAFGSITLSGFLAVAGCFLIGCCGSPMLGVYLSLFGAAVLPFAKPFVAGITTLFVIGSFLWMRRRMATDDTSVSEAACCRGSCSPRDEPVKTTAPLKVSG